MDLLCDFSGLEEKVNFIKSYFSNKTIFTNTCNCQHCIEIKKQLNRAEKRQCDLFNQI